MYLVAAQQPAADDPAGVREVGACVACQDALQWVAKSPNGRAATCTERGRGAHRAGRCREARGAVRRQGRMPGTQEEG
jgi:hypothetical protein